MNSGFANPRETWDARFDRDDYIFGTTPNVFLASQCARLMSGQRALCVADGEGRNSVWLARRGLQVQAFDLAAAGVAKARRLAQEHGVTVDFQVADCDDYVWPEAALDGVAAIFVQFADPVLRARLFANMAASLAPGGLLVLQGYTPKQLEFRTGGPPIASHLYTAPMLREAFAALEIVELREYEAELREGSGHLGHSALIGMVARRP
jgi:SAM-dependent methyltransferase